MQNIFCFFVKLQRYNYRETKGWIFVNFCYDVLNYKYPSRREVVYGRKGMVCTSQSLAAQAGLDIIKAGGNAVDAALATAACMIVLEPTSNGFGSDAFAQVWMDGKLYGLNASGFSPALLTREALMDKGYEQMPKFGWEPVTVPGVFPDGRNCTTGSGHYPGSKSLNQRFAMRRKAM